MKNKEMNIKFKNANMLMASAGTTGYCGGDTGHGGKTFFEIVGAQLFGEDIEVRVINKNKKIIGASFTLGGDLELKATIEVLEFIVNTLKEQIEEKETQDKIETKQLNNHESKTKRLQLLIRPSTHEAMVRQAKEKHISVNELLNLTIEEFLKGCNHEK